MKVYVAGVVSLLILAGLFLAWVLPFGPKEQKEPLIFSDQMASLTALLPDKADMPDESPAECAVPVTQRIIRRTQATLPSPEETPQPAESLVEQKPPVPTPASIQPALSVVPISAVYFYGGAGKVTPIIPYTGVPVQRGTPVKLSVVPVIYTGGLTPIVVAPVRTAVVPQPVVPIFIPQVVPSRIGVSKLVYPNGVVIKPKVYYPNQPIRNSFRAVTP